MGLGVKKLAARAAALVAAAALALGATALAWADEPTAYRMWIAGTQVTSENAGDVLGDGTVSFDAEKNTLTLDGACIGIGYAAEASQYADEYGGIIEGIADPVTIVLVGENKIVYEGEAIPEPEGDRSAYIEGIYSYFSSDSGASVEFDKTYLTITGDGSLSIEIATPPLRAVGEETTYTPVGGISFNPGIARIEADVDIFLGDDEEGASRPNCSGVNGYIYHFAGDANVNIRIGKSMAGGTCLNSMEHQILENANVSLYVDDGVYESCGGNGARLIVTDNATIYSDMGSGKQYSMGYSCGDTQISGNAKATFISRGNGATEPTNYWVSCGLNTGNFAVSDNAVVAMTGEDIGYAGPTPILAHHEVGGAIVSETHDPLPTDAVAWDGSIELNAWNEEHTGGVYKYVRIPYTEEALADIVAAGEVLDDIQALPEADDATEADKEDVLAAKKAFDKLTDDQKALLPEDEVAKLDALYELLRDPVVKRLAGDYANETAAAISAEAFPQGSEWVVIARDDDFADALGATGLAGALECPIVLTGRTQLSEAAAEEISRLGAKHAYVIGGTGAIKEQVDADLAALGVSVEPRVWGENSYDTSLECAKEIVKVTGSDDPKVIVAMSTNFQDALSISPIAYRLKCPLVLQTWGATSAERGFTKEAAAWLAGKAPLVVGGPGAISDASFEGIELKNAPFRIYGETGYDTSDAIAEWAVATGWLTDSAAVFACGAQAPRGTDALAGSALAGRLGCPILLVNGNEAMESVNTTTVDGYFAEHAASCKDLYILGGGYVMPPALVERIEGLLDK